MHIRVAAVAIALLAGASVRAEARQGVARDTPLRATPAGSASISGVVVLQGESPATPIRRAIVTLTGTGIATSTPQLKAGRIKALAIGGPSRTPLFPEVPTFAELGYPEVETHAWFGLFVPAGSPREAVTRIYRDTRKILDEPEFRQKQLIDKGYEVVGSGPEEFAAYVAKDSESRARAVKISGAKAE